MVGSSRIWSLHLTLAALSERRLHQWMWRNLFDLLYLKYRGSFLSVRPMEYVDSEHRKIFESGCVERPSESSRDSFTAHLGDQKGCADESASNDRRERTFEILGLTTDVEQSRLEFNTLSILDGIIRCRRGMRYLLGSRGRSSPGHIKNNYAFTPLRSTLSKPSNGSRSNRWRVIHHTPKRVFFIPHETQDTQQRKEDNQMRSTLHSFCRRGIVLVCATVVACVFGLEVAAQTPIVMKLGTVNPGDSPRNIAAYEFAKVLARSQAGESRSRSISTTNSPGVKERPSKAFNLERSMWRRSAAPPSAACSSRSTFRLTFPLYGRAANKSGRSWTARSVRTCSREWRPGAPRGYALGAAGDLDTCSRTSDAIYTPDDMKGQTIRVQESPIYIGMMKQLGANPVPMPWGEVYLAMKQGTVDGMESPTFSIVSDKFTEVTKFISLTNHTLSAHLVVHESKKYQALPADLRQAVDESRQGSMRHGQEGGGREGGGRPSGHQEGRGPGQRREGPAGVPGSDGAGVRLGHSEGREGVHGSVHVGRKGGEVDPMLKRIVSNAVEWVCMVLMVVLSIDLLLGVFSRYVLVMTFTWYDEIARGCFVWLTLLGAAVGVKRHAHFRLHLVVDRLPQRLQKAVAVLAPVGDYGLCGRPHPAGLGIPRARAYSSRPRSWGCRRRGSMPPSRSVVR